MSSVTEKSKEEKKRWQFNLGEKMGLQKHNNPSYISLIDCF